MSDTSRPAAAEAELATLLRLISRDVAHELRGPVQSIVVNLEVLRRKSEAGDKETVTARADVIEQEIRRMHALTEAFVALLRAPGSEPVIVSADSMLAAISPLFEVIAKAARIRVERPDPAATALLRIRSDPASLALLRAFIAARDAAGEGGTIAIATSAGEDRVAFRIEAQAPDPVAAGQPIGGPFRLAMPAIERWLDEAGGTADLEAGSDTQHPAVVVRLPRAT